LRTASKKLSGFISSRYFFAFFATAIQLCFFSEAEFGKGLHDWVDIIVKTNGYFTETKVRDPKPQSSTVFSQIFCSAALGAEKERP
jgi:hypothetical protein